jgi:hypothetical protein
MCLHIAHTAHQLIGAIREGVGHDVAVGRVAVPGLQRDHLAHLLADEVVGEDDALIEALLGADLHDELGRLRPLLELLALLDGDAHWLLHQDVLAGFEGHRDVKRQLFRLRSPTVVAVPG